MRVLESSGEHDFPLEPFHGDAGGHLEGEDLDDDLASEGDLAGDEDMRHASACELVLERVGIAERGLEEVADAGHVWSGVREEAE